jgi:L-asparaginase
VFRARILVIRTSLFKLVIPADANNNIKAFYLKNIKYRTQNVTMFESKSRKVLILYHGGTIGMQPDAQGSLRPVRGFLNAQLAHMEELQKAEMPSFDVSEFDEIVDSSDVTAEDWKLMCEKIQTNYHEYDGFVIIHGTDTMAYSASALSFMLENLAKPVVFVGAQLPFGEVHSDARRNVGVAILIAGRCDLPEVCIFFNDRLFRGNRAVKIDSVGVAAFDSPNCPALATLGTEVAVNDRLLLGQPKGKFAIHTSMDNHILVLRLVPGFIDLDGLSHSGVRGVVLLLYGTGNAPARRQGLLQWVRKMIESGVHVVVVSQCLKGRVELHKYAVGRQLAECGVISGADMTCEAAVAKLSYLLGRELSHEQVKVAMEQNLRGELTENPDTAFDLFKGMGGLITRL